MKIPRLNITRSRLLGSIFIVLFALVCYFPILDSPFKVVYDSDHIVNNGLLKDTQNIGKILTGNLFRVDAPYRPVTLLSHMAEGQLFKLVPFYYYLVNILLHAACALLIFAVIALASRDRVLGFVTALLFAVHPAHWEAVSFLSGRAVLLNTFFVLLSLASCMLYMRRLNGWWMCLSLIGFTGALLSHEAQSSVLPVFLFYILFLSKEDHSKGLRWLIFLPYAVLAVVFYVFRHGLRGYQFEVPQDTMDWGLRLMAGARSLALEINVFTSPFHIHFHQSASTMQGMYDSTAIAALVLIIVALVFALFRWKTGGLVLFLIVWFVCASWPLMTNAFHLGVGPGRLPLDGTVTYLAAIPWMALLILGIGKLLFVIPKRNFLGLIVLGLVIIVFAGVTFRQNILSTDEIALIKDARRYEPDSPIIEYDLGIIYGERGSNSESQAHFERAVELDPNFTSARMGLGKVLYEQGRLLEAAGAYESITRPGRYESVLKNNLRGIYRVLILDQEAIVRTNPEDLNTYFNLGVLYEKIGDINRAIAAYQEVIELAPDDQSALRIRALKSQGLIYQQLGQTAKAQDNFARAH